jgi:ethanolamine utilization protein EutN
MQIAEVIGRVTLSKWYPEFTGARWLIAIPLSGEALRGGQAGRGEPYVVYDELAASEHSMIGVSDGAEAAAPFQPRLVPLDAYNAAIFDAIEIHRKRESGKRKAERRETARKPEDT